jgi:hypothetical protein
LRFPQFFARVANETGRVSARGWSDASASEAAANARARLERIERWLRSGKRGDLERYAYGADDVIVEEVLERFPLNGDGGEAVVTRNAYGAEVLNNDRVLFVDVDVPPPPAPGLVGRLLGRKSASHDSLLAARADEIARWQRANPDLSLRGYRTHSGLRLVVLNALFAPGEPRGTAVLDALCNDPLYRALCRRQRCYRARLTPKPWRIGLRAPPRVAGRGDAGPRAEPAWLATYAERSAGAAVCRPFATWGNAAAHPVVAQVLAFHDRRTGCAAAAKPLR